MINILLDEPRWNELEARLEALIKGHPVYYTYNESGREPSERDFNFSCELFLQDYTCRNDAKLWAYNLKFKNEIKSYGDTVITLDTEKIKDRLLSLSHFELKRCIVVAGWRGIVTDWSTHTFKPHENKTNPEYNCTAFSQETVSFLNRETNLEILFLEARKLWDRY